MVTIEALRKGWVNQQPSAKLWSVQSKRAVHRLNGGWGKQRKVGIMLIEKFKKSAPVNHNPDELDLPLRYSQSPSREVRIMF
jgi:hypothetical protein